MSKILEMNELGIAVLPLRDLILFPNLTASVLVGRENSIAAVNYALNSFDKKIFVVTQKDNTIDDVSIEDIYEFGVISQVIESISLPDGTLKITLKAEELGYISSLKVSDVAGWFGSVSLVKNKTYISSLNEKIASQNMVIEVYNRYSKIKKIYDQEFNSYLSELTDSFIIAYNIAVRIDMKISDKQSILANCDEQSILENIIVKLESEIKVLEIERKIKNRVRSQIEKNQKEYFLNEQMKAIQKELGDGEDLKEEICKIEDKIKKVKLSDHARETAKSELKKLKHISQYSAENSIIKNYLDFLLSLPWQIFKKQNRDAQEIRNKLNESHFGMQEVKDRIYELILQKNRVKDISKSPILCFYGAPGIGKTSISYAIGNALGIPTISIPLGGVKDESVLRGHRKTYVGAMPGKIIQAIKDAKSSNLVIILDEIGSIGTDWRGNPEDVLLEILDPIQNKYFQDNYLATGFDLSNIIFVATTNSVSEIKPALLDRLEVIKLSGYTQEEKLKIAYNYILPRLLKDYGLDYDQIAISEDIMKHIIRFYTYEAGVRGLEKQLSKILRKTMCLIEDYPDLKVNINLELLEKMLKKPVYFDEYKDRDPRKGVVTGLGYVEGRAGQEGELLSIESALIPGDGKVEFTGNLGDMMKESIQIAQKLLISNSEKYKIDLEGLKKKNFYVNFPSGGTPKDGPSAGSAIFCSLYSTIKDIAFPNNVAITGEISLYNVLKVGGIKEKIIAAYRHGIKKAFIPYDNKIDLIDIDKDIMDDMNIIPVKTVDEILQNLNLLA